MNSDKLQREKNQKLQFATQLLGGARTNRQVGQPLQYERPAIGVAEFAARLGISVHCARNWAYRRKISSTKLGKLLFIPVGEIDRLIQENLTPALSSTDQAVR